MGNQANLSPKGEMDPRKLRYFATVVEQGSFNRAAKKLSISQPALSMSMDRLERSLGQQLLDRGSLGVTPTPLGELLYGHAQLIRNELDLAERHLSAKRNQDENTIAFGTLPSLAHIIVPEAVCKWRKTHQDKILRVTEKIQWDLLFDLLRGELDFLVAQTEYYDILVCEGLKQRVLFRDLLYVIARPGHPAFDLESLSWTSLGDFPWILQMFGKNRVLVEELFASEGLSLPRKLTECGSVHFIKSLVANSNSLALLPSSAVDKYVRNGLLRPLDITSPLLKRNIAVIYSEQFPLSDDSRALVNQIEGIGSSLGPDQHAYQVS